MASLALLPEMYPLSASMVQHLAAERKIAYNIPIPLEVALSFEDQITYLRQHYVTTWQPLLDEVASLRSQACEALADVLSGKEILTGPGFLDVLQQYAPQKVRRRDAQQVSLSRWRGRGLLRYEDRGRINADTAVAVLMMRLALSRDHKFLPSGSYVNEPYMYVWNVNTPTSPPTPCGVPLQEIPRHAFLFTHWRFLGILRSDWLPFGEFGSVRWGGVTTDEHGQLLWDLSDDDLRIWDPSIAVSNTSIPESIQKQTRHTLANLVLLRLAGQYLMHSSVTS